MAEYTYQSYEIAQSFQPTDKEYEMFFNDIPEAKRQEFAYVKGSVVTRGLINKKFIQFSDKALEQARSEFEPLPYQLDHSRELMGNAGTVTALELGDKGLSNYSAIPRTSKNLDFIEMLENDFAGLIKQSIGGVSNSIKCSICGMEVFQDFDHWMGEKYDGRLAYGIVQEWRSKEISATLFPADDGADLSIYQTGFSEFDDLLQKQQKLKSEALINNNNNNNGELNMTEPIKDEDKETSTPQDIEQKFTLEDVQKLMSAQSDELKASFSDKFSALDSIMAQMNAEKEKAKEALVVQLSGLTGKEKEVYASFSEDALGQMIELAGNTSVPDEKGRVEGGSKRKVSKLDPFKRKSLASIILNIKAPSERALARANAYGYNLSLDGDYAHVFEDNYTRVQREASLRFAEDEDSEGDN
jgi:hypothetical protein